MTTRDAAATGWRPPKRPRLATGPAPRTGNASATEMERSVYALAVRTVHWKSWPVAGLVSFSSTVSYQIVDLSYGTL